MKQLDATIAQLKPTVDNILRAQQHLNQVTAAAVLPNNAKVKSAGSQQPPAPPKVPAGMVNVNIGGKKQLVKIGTPVNQNGVNGYIGKDGKFTTQAP